jgi:hypothetical protein
MAATVEQLQVEIKSNATSAAKGIDALASSLGKLKKATKNTGLDKFNKEIKNTSGYAKAAAASEKTALGYAKLASKVAVAVVAVKKVAKVISNWVTKSNDYVENLNLFTVSMGEFAGEAQKYAETVGEVMGIDPGEWMRNQGVFMTLATGFGVASDRANTMSKNLTQLGYDLSSFFNISYTESFQKLQSGLAGELEPLRRLGYDLSVARLQQEAYVLGIKKKVTAMTQAEKAELRYYAIMTQVTKAQGDMARTLNAPANQLRVMKAQVEQTGRALGNIFIPALNAVLPYAIALAKAVRMVADAIANAFGFKLPEIDYSGLDAVSGGAEELEDNLDNASKKAKKLKQNLLGIDELNIIAPDSNDDGGDSDTPAAGGGLGFELPTYDFLGDAVNTRIDDIFGRMKKWLEEIGNTAKNIGLVEAFEKVKTAVSSFADSSVTTTIGEIFGIIGDTTAVTALEFIRDVLNTITGILNGDLKTAVNSFKDLGINLTLNGLIGIADILDKILGTNLGGWLRDVKASLNDIDLSKFSGFKRLQTALDNVKESFKNLKESFANLISRLDEAGEFDNIKAFLEWFTSAAFNLVLSDIATILEVIAGVLNTISNLLNGDLRAGLESFEGLLGTLTFDPLINLAQVFDSIFGTKEAETYTKMKEALISFDLSEWLNDVGKSMREFADKSTKKLNDAIDSVVGWFKDLPGKIGEALSSAYEKVSTWAQDTYDTATTKISETIEDVKQWFMDLPGKIGYALGFALGTVVKWATDTYEYLKVKVPETVDNVKTWFSELPGKIGEAISSTVTKIGEWFNETNAKFKEKTNSIITNVKKWFSELPGKIKSAIDDTKNKLATWTSEMITKAKIEIPKIISKITGFFGDIPAKLKALGEDIWDGLINGLTEAWQTAKKSVKGLADGFVDGFKDALGIHSPSRVFYSLAQFVIQGFNNGLTYFGKSSEGVVNDWASGISSVVPTMSFAVDTSALKYYNTDSFSKSISANVSSHSSVTATGFKEGMEEFYREYVEPMMTQMASDMRRQADKNEQTIVQIGNRTVSDAVTTQQRANGYVFAR